MRQFAIRGYVVNRKQMENLNAIREDYFEHQPAEVWEIRLSERRFYQKLTDIYATSIDHIGSSPLTSIDLRQGHCQGRRSRMQAR